MGRASGEQLRSRVCAWILALVNDGLAGGACSRSPLWASCPLRTISTSGSARALEGSRDSVPSEPTDPLDSAVTCFGSSPSRCGRYRMMRITDYPMLLLVVSFVVLWFRRG